MSMPNEKHRGEDEEARETVGSPALANPGAAPIPEREEAKVAGRRTSMETWDGKEPQGLPSPHTGDAPPPQDGHPRHSGDIGSQGSATLHHSSSSVADEHECVHPYLDEIKHAHPLTRGVGVLVATPLLFIVAAVGAVGAVAYGVGEVFIGIGDIITGGSLKKKAAARAEKRIKTFRQSKHEDVHTQT